MKNASIRRTAAEEMALRAYRTGETVTDLFASLYEVRFDMRGHTPGETIERAVDITPELIAEAEAIVTEWRKGAK